MQQTRPQEKQYLSDAERALAEEESARLLRLYAMWASLGVGFCLVAFPSQFAFPFVAERIAGSGQLGWSPSAIEALAQTFRSVGFLLFGAGLVERVLIRFGK